MNYEDMSYFEIDKLVAGKIFDKSEWVCVSSWSDGDFVAKIVNHTQERFAPCNNPSDAWPIIIDNKIDICHAIDGGVSCGVFERTIYGDFQSRHITECDSEQEVLRAAMICFLKMKDTEK